jgi:hypothetical protein
MHGVSEQPAQHRSMLGTLAISIADIGMGVRLWGPPCIPPPRSFTLSSFAWTLLPPISCPAAYACSPDERASFMEVWRLSRACMRPTLCSSVAWALFLVIPCSIAILEGPLQPFAFSLVALTAPDDCAFFIVGWRRLPRTTMRMSLCPCSQSPAHSHAPRFSHLYSLHFHPPCKLLAPLDTQGRPPDLQAGAEVRWRAVVFPLSLPPMRAPQPML